MMKKRWQLQLVAVILLFLFFGWIYIDNAVLKGGFSGQEVVVATKKLPIDTIIEDEHLTTIKIPGEYVSKNTLQEPELIIGQRTTSAIEKYDAFSQDKLGDAELKKSKDEAYFALPNRWIESVPGSLRRLDSISIWLTLPEKEKEKGVKVDVDEEEKQFTATPIEVENEERPTGEPLVSNITVAFIKNSQNTEVQGVEKSKDRLDGNSSPSQLEVMMKKDDFAALSEAVSNGFKLIISY
jgi:hypothetical protein